jgi:mono/diheme cytochrome c family protein
VAIQGQLRAGRIDESPGSTGVKSTISGRGDAMRRNVKWGLWAAVAAAGLMYAGGEWTSLQAAEFSGDPGVAQELPAGVTPAMVEAGAGIYAGGGGCMTCHGVEGAGTPIGPVLSDGEWLHGDGSFDFLVQVITDGVMQPAQFGVPMLPKGGTQISDDDVRAVAAYVWTLSR